MIVYGIARTMPEARWLNLVRENARIVKSAFTQKKKKTVHWRTTMHGCVWQSTNTG